MIECTYNYDDNGRFLETGGTTYQYDNNGNTLSETLDANTKTYVWDGKNKLASVTEKGNTTTYTYSATGIRNSKTENGITTRYIVDSNRDHAQVLEEVENNSTTVQYAYGHDLINQHRESTTSFYHYDGLGSTRALSNSTGAFTDSYDYEAFGEIQNQTGATENNYLFTGEQFDSSLNQYYLRARYYDQNIGRFTQYDTWQGNNSDPITLHKYLYANANPASYTDPSGNMSLSMSMASFNVMATFTTMARGMAGAALLGSALVLSRNDAKVDKQVTPADIAIAKVKAKTCVSGGDDQCKLGIPTVIFGSDMWDATNHYWEAQTIKGLPSVLNRGVGFDRGWYSRLSIPECLGRGSSQQCDEYPFNSTTQGGPANYRAHRMSLKLINGVHNSAAGTLLNSMYSACGVHAGSEIDSTFAVIPVPSGASGFFCPGK